MLIAVNHHYIRESYDDPYPAIYGLTPQEFRRHLERMKNAGTFVSADQIYRALRGEVRLPRKSILITFDDGLREQHELAWPILQEMEIPALFFVNTAPIAFSTVSLVHKIHILRSRIAPTDFEQQIRRQAKAEKINLDAEIGPEEWSHYRYESPDVAGLKYLLNFVLDRDSLALLMDRIFYNYFEGGREKNISEELYMEISQVRELGHHGFIGSHSHEHLPLGLLSPQGIQEQLNLSIEWIKRWTGRTPLALSYPYGSREASGNGASRIAAECGFEYAFTMERAGNATLSDPLLFGRFDRNDMPGGKASEWTVDEMFDRVPDRTWKDENPGT